MNTKMANRKLTWMGLTALAALGVAGCGEPEAPAPVPQVPTVTPVNVDVRSLLPPEVDAGLDIEDRVAPPTATHVLASQMPFLTRNDPFALLRQEVAFDRSQRAERLLEDGGGFSTYYEQPPPPPPEPQVPPTEPQPYRRLAGILIGDAVLAIMELENGTTIIIRPGTRIPDTEWTVQSLDEDKAVLTRPGNRRPRSIVVPLENPRPGSLGGGGGGGTTGGGTTGGGLQPGTPPGAPGMGDDR